VGHNIFDLFHPDERAAATRLLEQIEQHPGSAQEASFRLRHQDGSWRWMEGILTNLLDEPAVQSVVINYRDVTDRKLREEEIRSRTDELITLYQLSRLLADANDLESVIELVNRQVVEKIHTTFACIALLEEGNLVPRGVYPVRNMKDDFKMGCRQPMPSLPVCQSVLEKNEPVILQSGSLEFSRSERALLLLDFAKSVCLVPMQVKVISQDSRLALGLLILGEARQQKREPFTSEKIRLARSIGDQAASNIRRVLLSQQTGRRLQRLTALSNIDRAISSSFDLHISLGLLLGHIAAKLGVDATDILLFNQDSNSLEFSAGRGFRTKSFEKARLRLGEGYAGQAALKREIIHIPDLAEKHDNLRLEKHLAEDHFVSYYGVPLISKGQIVGVLEIFQRARLEPDKEWLDFLNTLAGQAAIAIDSVMQFDNVQRSNLELTMAYDETIEGWSHALDLRDKETEGHTRRVTELTLKLAHAFGLGQADLVQVRWGALLHDIGKMGVPDGILLKPGPLTDEEWVAMKKHPTFAYEMLSPIHYLRLALDIPYCHHEKWDGTGYPRGLKGEQIPLTARIFAVVDVWDALTSDRPYRQAWSEEKAREHIQAGAGTHFDPQVVKTFFLEHE
jgi:putative nucleotidyltransferase with HDIG domain